MSLKLLLQEATMYFLRSQFVQSLATLQDASSTEACKRSVVLQCLHANNSVVCNSQSAKESTSSSTDDFEKILMSLEGVPKSKTQTVVECIVQYNKLITHLQKTVGSQIKANAASVAQTIQQYLSKDVLHALDGAGMPLVIMKCTLIAAQILAREGITDWSVLEDSHARLKESYCIAMTLASGCEVLTLSNENTSDDSLSLEGLIAVLKCVKACQNGQWQQALKIIKHKRHLWKGYLASEMVYVKAYCLYQLSSYEEARRCLSLLEAQNSSQSHVCQLLSCCLAKQGKYHLAVLEVNRMLSDASDDPLLLPLLNLSVLFSKLGKQDTALAILDQLVKASREPLKLADSPELIFHPDTGQQLSANEIQIKSLYHMAHRSLQSGIFKETAERYLDLISLLEETSVVNLSYSSLLPIDIPNIAQIYLEAALALLKAEQYEEAESICETILTRSGCLKATGQKTRGNEGDEQDAKFDAELRHSGERSSKIDGTPTRDSHNLQTSTKSTSERFETNGPCVGRRVSEMLTLASVCLLRSECLLKLKNIEMSLEALDDALHILHEYSSENRPIRESIPQSTAKRRKLDSDSTQMDPDSRQMASSGVSTDGVSSLKGRAYNNKALILIGQGRLNEALPILLSSLDFHPGNEDARRNLCLLLFKMGRKKEAYAEWRKLQNDSL